MGLKKQKMKMVKVSSAIDILRRMQSNLIKINILYFLKIRNLLTYVKRKN
jgi:hypothetical protein